MENINNERNKFLNIFSCCLLVKGYSRSVIYDLSRKTFDFIPNDLCLALKKANGKSLDFFYSLYEDQSECEEYLSFLNEKEYILFLDNENQINNFPSIDLKWDFPGDISNAMIDIKKEIPYDFFLLVSELEVIGCKHILLRFTDGYELIDVDNFISTYFTDSSVRSIDIILDYISNIEKYNFNTFFEKNQRVKSITFVKSPRTQKIFSSGTLDVVFCFEEDFSKNGIIDLGYFDVNLSLFTESMMFNTFFNMKLYIDDLGFIKNHPQQVRNFGNVGEYSIKDIVSTEAFKYLWYANKDSIDVCNVCEYRYMCVDSRVPIKRPDKSWYHLNECNYNPFIAKWEGEENYRDLEECGVNISKQKIEINSNKLRKILSSLYGEVD
jgi:SPASM domain peptide maturase of grasp-with-spasm system